MEKDYDITELTVELAKAEAEIERLTTVHLQQHNAVLDAIRHNGGLPDTVKPHGHPIEQIVGTVSAMRTAEIERLKAAQQLALRNLRSIVDEFPAVRITAAIKALEGGE